MTDSVTSPLPAVAGVVPARRPALVLGVVLLATFIINVDTTIVNVTLPALSRELHSTTSGLQWVVDAYNLAFAGLILTGGTVGDRYGRRRTLAAGLAVFGLGSAIAAQAGTTSALIGWRVLMGAAAAFIFPTTLSIISQTFPDRAGRAKAIGAWGAATGAAVALGPIVGGELLSHFWWGSVFWVMVPMAALCLIGTMLLIPADQRTPAEPLDLPGLALSAVGLTSLVYTIIEAPDHGWASARTLLGFAIAASTLATLVVVEARETHPMLDVRLFTNMRFTAASGAVTLAWFALSGFVFLIILYFQIMRGYSPLEAGVRTLPVAISVGVFSGIGTALAVRLGNKLVVSAGLVLVGLGYAWVAAVQTEHTSYAAIVAQMLFLGSGIGLSTAPATEAILGVLRPEKAGVGSAVNDATRLVGGTLGVAILGSVYASLYHRQVDTAAAPAAARDAAKASYGASRIVAAHLPPDAAHSLIAHANTGFLDGLHAGCTVAAAVCALGALIVVAFLPAHPEFNDVEDSQPIDGSSRDPDPVLSVTRTHDGGASTRRIVPGGAR